MINSSKPQLLPGHVTPAKENGWTFTWQFKEKEFNAELLLGESAIFKSAAEAKQAMRSYCDFRNGEYV